MPGYDRTGPMGAGPMTGGGRGRCRVADVAFGRSFTGNRAMNRGMRWGCGNGRGRWNQTGFAAVPINTGEEVNRLKAEAEFLKNDLDLINSRITSLEGSQSKE